MARKHQTLTDLFSAIAGAIRSKTNGTEQIVADDFPDAISSISTGIELPALTNPAAEEQVLEGYEAFNADGNIVMGGMPIVEQSVPSISINNSGLITASVSQEAGYVRTGSKSATEQLTTQAAQTITPGTANKTIASGRYLTGVQTIKGDANLLAANIKSGVSIFGVAGSFSGGFTATVTGTGSSTLTIPGLKQVPHFLAICGRDFADSSTSSMQALVYEKGGAWQDGWGNYIYFQCNKSGSSTFNGRCGQLDDTDTEIFLVSGSSLKFTPNSRVWQSGITYLVFAIL